MQKVICEALSWRPSADFTRPKRLSSCLGELVLFHQDVSSDFSRTCALISKVEKGMPSATSIAGDHACQPYYGLLQIWARTDEVASTFFEEILSSPARQELTTRVAGLDIRTQADVQATFVCQTPLLWIPHHLSTQQQLGLARYTVVGRLLEWSSKVSWLIRCTT